jgi:hypothetical protein
MERSSSIFDVARTSLSGVAPIGHAIIRDRHKPKGDERDSLRSGEHGNGSELEKAIDRKRTQNTT